MNSDHVEIVERIVKLPVWAQAYIRRLESENARMRDEVDQVLRPEELSGTDTSVLVLARDAGLGFERRALRAQAEVEFLVDPVGLRMPAGKRAAITVSTYRSNTAYRMNGHDSGLTVSSASGSILVLPVGSNTVQIMVAR